MRVLIEGVQSPDSNQEDKEGLIGDPTVYLYLSSGWAGRSLVFLEGVGAGLLCEQYCWLGPRGAGMRCRERCRRRPGAAGGGAAAAQGRREEGARGTSSCQSACPDLPDCSAPPPPPRGTQRAWRCTGSLGRGPGPGGRRRSAEAGEEERQPEGTGTGACSPAAAEVCTDPAPPAPATCARPPRAVCASRLPGGCNSLLPDASAGRTDKSAKVRVGTGLGGMKGHRYPVSRRHTDSESRGRQLSTLTGYNRSGLETHGPSSYGGLWVMKPPKHGADGLSVLQAPASTYYATDPSQLLLQTFVLCCLSLLLLWVLTYLLPLGLKTKPNPKQALRGFLQRARARAATSHVCFP